MFMSVAEPQQNPKLICKVPHLTHRPNSHSSFLYDEAEKLKGSWDRAGCMFVDLQHVAICSRLIGLGSFEGKQRE